MNLNGRSSFEGLWQSLDLNGIADDDEEAAAGILLGDILSRFWKKGQNLNGDGRSPVGLLKVGGMLKEEKKNGFFFLS